MRKDRNVLTVRPSTWRGNLGTCIRCAKPWRDGMEHATPYRGGRNGCFPLCKPCWADLTPLLRLPYYRILVFEVWESPEDWPDIEAAVLSGL